HLGEFPSAMEHFEKALLHYDPKRHLDDAFLYSLNQGVAARCFAAWALWFVGQPEQSLVRIREALTLARETREPHGLAHALFFAAILHQLRREAWLARECAGASIAVSSEHGLLMYQAFSTIVRGWSMIEPGPNEESIELIRQGLEGHQATGANLMRPHFLGLLIEALGNAHRTEEALSVLQDALAVAHRTGELSYEAELYRIKGELLLEASAGRGLSRAASAGGAIGEPDSAGAAEAEICFMQAIRTAQQQKARSWELRSAISLARLYQDQGKREEGRDTLLGVYGRFTEGFDTADLREAREMLDRFPTTGLKDG